MERRNNANRNIYYSASHEWIDFNNMEANIGITSFRLIGIKQIKYIEFVRVYGFKKRGEVLANIQLSNGRLQVYMPVDGSIISINDTNLLVDQHLLLTRPETDGWLAKILVSQPCLRKGLLLQEEYHSIIQKLNPH